MPRQTPIFKPKLNEKISGSDSESINLTFLRNPSFEEHIICPTETEQFVGYVNDWHSFFGTPDYNNTCGYAPYVDLESISPKSGEGYVGVRWFNHNGPDLPREYIQGEIKTPLLAEETYYFSFYSHVVPFTIAINQHSAHFSNELIIDVPISSDFLELDSHIQNIDSIHTEMEWVKISGCYTALGGESFVTLGNTIPRFK